MGARAYPLIENYARSVTASIVEIGGERGEGSTSFLRAFAERTRVPFHTVDMVNTNMTGEDWLRQVFPAKHEQVSFAYLDNFDWTYEAFKHEPWHKAQVADYARAGLTLNNQNAMAVHLEQTQLLEPFAARNCAVLFDDTWPLPDGGWTGKGGTAIPWLLDRGWRVLESSPIRVETFDGFALVARGEWRKRVVIRKPVAREWQPGDPHRDFNRIAVAAAHRLGPGQTLVLYGMGQNGQRLLQLLLAAGVPVAYIDDNFEGDIEAPRLRTEDLGPGHTVLITPDASNEIYDRLRPLPIDVAWTPGSLLAK